MKLRGKTNTEIMTIQFDGNQDILDNIPLENPCDNCIIVSTCDKFNDTCAPKIIFLTFGVKGDVKNENQNRLCNKQQFSISLGSDSGQF